jgi:hypothetical protein
VSNARKRSYTLMGLHKPVREIADQELKQDADVLYRRLTKGRRRRERLERRDPQP